jgi:hypothetical protein
MSRPHARRARAPVSHGGHAVHPEAGGLYAGRGNAALAAEHAASRQSASPQAGWLSETTDRFFSELGKGSVAEGLTHGVAAAGGAAGVQFSGAGPVFPQAVARGGPLGRMAEPLTGAASGGAVVGGALEAGLEAMQHLEGARQPGFDASDATGDVVAAGLVGTLMGGVGIGAGSLLLGAGEILAPAALMGAGAAAAPLAMLVGGALAATALADQSEALTGWLGAGLGDALNPAERGLRHLWRGAGAATGLAAPPPRAGRRAGR